MGDRELDDLSTEKLRDLSISIAVLKNSINGLTVEGLEINEINDLSSELERSEQEIHDLLEERIGSKDLNQFLTVVMEEAENTEMISGDDAWQF